MANDALDPGPNGDYPFVPRNPDGTVDRRRFPRGAVTHRTPNGGRVRIDLTMRDREGNEIPPPIPPDGEEG